MQLENQTLHDIRRDILPVPLHGSLHRQHLQVIRFQLDTVQPIDTSQLLHLLYGVLLAHHDLALLVAGKLVEKILFREFLPVLLLRTHLRGNRKHRHQRIGIQLVFLHFIHDLLRVLQHLRDIAEQSLHLRRGLEPLLAGISHPVRVIQILPGIQTNQQVVRLGILLVQEMHVVRGDHLDPQPLAHLQDFGVTLHLIVVHFRPLLRRFRGVTHHLEIIIVAH